MDGTTRLVEIVANNVIFEDLQERLELSAAAYTKRLLALHDGSSVEYKAISQLGLSDLVYLQSKLRNSLG